MKIGNVLSYLGLIFEVNGILLFFFSALALFLGDNYSPFLFSSIASLSIGILMEKRYKRSEELNLKQAMILSTLTFLFVPLVNSFVYLGKLGMIDAYFESVSGITTTGLSVLDVESSSMSIVLWRSFTQWIGGFGILLVFLLLVSSHGISSFYIYKAEGREKKIEPSSRKTVMRIFKIYATYTIVSTAIFLLSGMSPFDSVNYAMTALSTGGFATTAKSFIGASPFMKVAAMMVMIIGATSFVLHDRIWRRKIVEYFSNLEIKTFWVLLLIFFILVSIASNLNIVDGMFEVVSALTTTGFSSVNVLNPFTKFLLIILMVIGACSNSTGGGLKLIRFSILAKSFTWFLKKSSFPSSAVIPLKIENRKLKAEDVTLIAIFSFIYIIILLSSGIVISMFGYAPIDAIFLSASAQGTVGLSTLDVAGLNAFIKLILIFQMVIGRLEIIPMFVLLRFIILGEWVNR